MKLNEKMRHRLQASDGDISDGVLLQHRLSKIIESGFVISDSCIFWKEMENLVEMTGLEGFEDRTGYECFVNKIHVEDYLNKKKITEQETFEQGVAFVKKLSQELSAKFPGTKFEIILSMDGPNCVVWFHTVWDGEEWLAEDLDGYKDESILVVRT